MAKIQLKNNKGQVLEIGETSPFILTSIKGHGGLDIDIGTQKSFKQDGSTAVSKVAQERTVSISIAVIGETEEEKKTNLATLNNFMDIRNEMLMFYGEQNSSQKFIKINLKRTPQYDEEFNETPNEKIVNVVIYFIANNPFWQEVSEHEEELKAWLGGLEFPLSLPMQFSRPGKTVEIDNNGDVEIPLKIEFFGPATNPTVTNLTTNKFIKIEKVLTEGQSLVIDTDIENISVMLKDGAVETNAFSYITLDSDFFQLERGINSIGYSADLGEDNASVSLSYSKRYLGV